MDISWLLAGVVILAFMFFIASCNLARNAIVAARNNSPDAPVSKATWVMGTIVIVVGITLSILIAEKFSITHGRSVLILVVGGGLWILMLLAAKRIVLHYHPGTTFLEGRDVAIETLGPVRRGHGPLHEIME